MNSLRIAAIGCGAALEHLYVNPLKRIASKGWISVVGLSDPSETRRKWAGDIFPNARLSSTVDELFEGERIDLTLIVSPPPLHAKHVQFALGKSSHVLCEKPIADRVSSAVEMCAAAERLGRLLSVGMTRRFYPCLAEMKQWIREARLGAVRSYRYLEGSVYAWPITSDAPFRRESSGGGVLLDKGVHVLDTLLWVLGEGHVVASEDDSQVGGVEGNSLITIDHGTFKGTVQLSWDQDINNVFFVQCESGEMMVPIGPLHEFYFRKYDEPWQKANCTRTWAKDMKISGGKQGQPRTYYECIDLQLIQMLRAIQYNESVPTKPADGLFTLRQIEESYRCARPLKQPWLSPEEETRAIEQHWNRTLSPAR